MLEYELFIRGGEGGEPHLRGQPFGSADFLVFRDHAITKFTPLSLTFASINNGNVLPQEMPMTPLPVREAYDNRGIGYLELPSFGVVGMQAYQVVSFPYHPILPCQQDEILRGEYHPTEATRIQFIDNKNEMKCTKTPDEITPLGKVHLSSAKHSTQLAQELRDYIPLAIRQTKNIHERKLPALNAFLHAGEFVTDVVGQDDNRVLVLLGHYQR